MRVRDFCINVAFCFLPCAAAMAQAPSAATPVASQTPTAAPSTLSSIVRPALDTVQQTISALKLDKWKRGTVRDEAGDNVSAILRDIQTSLPPLLSAADAAPDTVSQELPVSKNIGALYDVLLRVNEASRVAAPADQVTQIDQALNTLKQARLALDDLVQASASNLEKQVADLQGKLQAQAAIKCPAVPAAAPQACVAPTPARKPKRKPKPPATTQQPTTPAPAATTPKPQN